MNLRHGIYTGLAGLHLILVVCGAAGWQVLSPKTEAGHALRLIRTYTGSDSSYAFFAPGVSSQMRARFILIDQNGKEWTDELDSTMGREGKLRAGSGLSMAAEFPDLMRVFGKSWAATMLGRHPTATKVIALVDIYELPPMVAYTEGYRPEWVQIYREEFNRK
jgi:hypothetical protein